MAVLSRVLRILVLIFILSIFKAEEKERFCALISVSAISVFEFWDYCRSPLPQNRFSLKRKVLRA